MNNRILYIILIFCTVSIAVQAKPAGNVPGTMSNEAVLLFTENKGQVADANGHFRPDILFTASGNGAKVFLTANGFHYQFVNTEYPAGYERDHRLVKDPVMQECLRAQIVTHTFRFSLSLDGANPNPKVYREERNNYVESFYLAHCPQGITNVPTFGRIVYKDVYPGIDWVIRSNKSGLKYDFVVHPGGNPARIKLRVTDADGVVISENGELVMSTNLGTVREAAPVSYCGGQAIATRFVQDGINSVRFALGEYDRTKALTIDPNVSWSTYYGVTADDYVNGCATDGAGNVFIVGETTSATGLASSGSYQTSSAGSVDAFVVKFNSTGSRLWGTFYGGIGAEHGTTCATDSSGSIYVGGYTNSTSGIASGGFQNAAAGGLDGYLVKFNSTGARLWGTYYGGSVRDNVYACAVDHGGNVYIAGQSLSSTGIAEDGYQNFNATMSAFEPYGDAFLAKFDSSGDRIWGTYYGGTSGDMATACTVDAADNVFLVGYGYSSSGIASNNGFQLVLGGYEDAFIVKFDNSCNRLWGTYCGGTGEDFAYTCTVDQNGNAYIGGTTTSATGIASNGFQNTYSGNGAIGDAFFVKFNPGGDRVWGTYYGSTDMDKTLFSATDATGHVYFGGQTASTIGIASNGFQNTIADSTNYDAFIAKFDTVGSRVWGSYFGGISNELGNGCAVRPDGSVIYLCGSTASSSGIASGGFQNTYGGNNFDGFLLKINDPLPAAISTISATPLSLCAGSNLTVTYNIAGSFNSGNTFTAQLSDASGSFAAPVNIGTITSTTGGTILCTIPAGTSVGTGYRVRLIASMPVMISTDNGANISIDAAPSVTITQTGNILNATPGFVSYGWYLNGDLIAGATGATYTPVQNGTYTVVVMNAGQCSDTSLPVSLMGMSVAYVAGVPGLCIYPIPATTSLILDFSATTLRSAVITISDISGKILYRTTGRMLPTGNSIIDINTSQWATGHYLLQISDGAKVAFYKFTKE